MTNQSSQLVLQVDHYHHMVPYQQSEHDQSEQSADLTGTDHYHPMIPDQQSEHDQ